MEKINMKDLHKFFIEIQKNDIEFEKFYIQYKPLIYSIAFSILKNKDDSDDVTQKVFIKIWNIDKNKLPTYNEASWLYSVTKNESLNHIRSKKKESNIQDIYYIGIEDYEINQVIERDYFNKIIERLNQTEKEIVTLKIIGNFSFKEISKLLNLSIGTIEWKYYKSIKVLRTFINNIGIFIAISMIFTTRILNKRDHIPNSLEVVNEPILELNWIDVVILLIFLMHFIYTMFSTINFIKFKKNTRINVSK